MPSLHREPDGMPLVELEVAYGERPYSYPNTYQAVRSWVDELNRADTLFELYGVTARAVRDLTGFDRVMVDRYDDDDDSYNGEIVAEAKRDDLNPALGLHYPSTAIPAQTRALYEANWLRLISPHRVRMPHAFVVARCDGTDRGHARRHRSRAAIWATHDH